MFVAMCVGVRMWYWCVFVVVFVLGWSLCPFILPCMKCILILGNCCGICVLVICVVAGVACGSMWM